MSKLGDIAVPLGQVRRLRVMLITPLALIAVWAVGSLFLHATVATTPSEIAAIH